MSIDIDKLIKSSYLTIEEDKKDIFKKNIQNTIKMLDELPKISDIIEDVEHSMDLRADDVCKSLDRSEVLMSSKAVKAGCFVVPKTVD